MLLLPHGCHAGKISVHPSSWDQPGEKIKSDWYIHYRFHHPNFKDKYPKGFLVIVRGMNHAKGLIERRSITRALIENEKANLQEGYNPITKKVDPPVSQEFEIPPGHPFPYALDKAFALLPETVTKKEIGKALVHIGKAIDQLDYCRLEVSKVRQRHIKAVLEKVARNKKLAKEQKMDAGKQGNFEWGASSFNHYRSYLQILFNQLIELDATEVDPVTKLKKKKGIKRIRPTLSSEDVQIINERVRQDQYTLWRFIHIFFHSGARMAEMMRLRKEDVSLATQRFKLVVMKGRQPEEVSKTIKDLVLQLWEEVMAEAQPGNYLFSRDLRPGPSSINRHQVTRRWRVHVKQKLGITADFYSLKHKNSTETVSLVSRKIEQAMIVAASQNSQRGTDMMRKVYDVGQGERMHEELKKVGNPLV